MNNIFNNPTKYREILKTSLTLNSILDFKGKGFTCVLINSRCHIGCEHCMFSATMNEKKNIKNTFTPEGINKLIQFLHDSNTGYLLLSSAGEGFLEKDLIFKILKEVKVEVIWVVTSGFWAQNYETAERILDELFESFSIGQTINSNRKIFLRISVDSFHLKKMQSNRFDKFQHIVNIIKLFDTKYSKNKHFKLLLHSLENEFSIVQELSTHLSAKILNIKKPDLYKIKDTTKVVNLELPSGFLVETSFAKLLFSDLTANIQDIEQLEKSISIFDRDIKVEKGNPAIKQNMNSSYGPNMLVWYDGSVSFAWQSEMPDLDLNIYKDDFKTIKENTTNDPGTLATIENGFQYRENIIDEVNPKSILRSKAVNIRDYTSKVLLEEDKTKLYYSIRVIQDFLELGRINQNVLLSLPILLKEFISYDRETLKKNYNNSNFDIINQYINLDPLYFNLLINIIKEYTIDGNESIIDDFFSHHNEISYETIKKWDILFKRIKNNWYDISSLSKKELLSINILSEKISDRMLIISR